MTLLTPRKLLEAKPSIQNFFNDAQIGYLFSLGLARGKKLSRTSLVCLEDVQAMVEVKKKIKTPQ